MRSRCPYFSLVPAAPIPRCDLLGDRLMHEVMCNKMPLIETSYGVAMCPSLHSYIRDCFICSGLQNARLST